MSLCCCKGPVCETILCRGPCLDTHPSPRPANHPLTDTHHHPPTLKPTILQFQSDVRLSVRGESDKNKAQLPGLSLPPISPWPKPDISAFNHSADSSTLTSHTVSSARASQSVLTLIYHCWQAPALSFDTCLPTPTRRQRKSQQVTLTVCRPAAQNTTNTQQHSFRQ